MGIFDFAPRTTRVLYLPGVEEGDAKPNATMFLVGFYALVLIGLIVLASLSMVEGGNVQFLYYSIASASAFFCGCLCFARPLIKKLLVSFDKCMPYGRVGSELSRIVRDIVIILLVAACGFCALELCYNTNLLPLNEAPSIFEFELILAAVALGYFVTQRTGVGPAIAVVLCFLIGLAEYFVIKFKGNSIFAADIYALDTAMEVSSGYNYIVSSGVLFGLVFVLWGVCLSSFITISRKTAQYRVANVLMNVVAALVCWQILFVNLVQTPVQEAFDITPSWWNSIGVHEENGFLPVFLSEIQSMAIKPPESYTADKAAALIDSYANYYDEHIGNSEARQAAEQQFESVKPNVIAIMDESFSDLSIMGGLNMGYTGPQFWNSGFGDALSQGALYVSTYGGGTANTEFEFLTNESVSFIGAGKVAYSMYDMSGIDTLPKQFKALGYETTAIHPENPQNWRRQSVYPAIGFDKFLSIEDFKKTHYTTQFHSGISDSDTFNYMADLADKSDKPQFIFTVTMQNHGGYTQNNIPADKLTRYHVEGAGDDAQLNEYLSCIEESDRAIQALIERLRNTKRPTVVVIFGDHQPGIGHWYNDALFPNEAEHVHASRIYQTAYRMWANYDVAGNSQQAVPKDMSASDLSTLLLTNIGAPLSQYQKALIGMRTQIPITYLGGYKAADGTLYAQEDTTNPYAKLYQDLGSMEYYHFGRIINGDN